MLEDASRSGSVSASVTVPRRGRPGAVRSRGGRVTLRGIERGRTEMRTEEKAPSAGCVGPCEPALPTRWAATSESEQKRSTPASRSLTEQHGVEDTGRQPPGSPRGGPGSPGPNPNTRAAPREARCRPAVGDRGHPPALSRGLHASA